MKLMIPSDGTQQYRDKYTCDVLAVKCSDKRLIRSPACYTPGYGRNTETGIKTITSYNTNSTYAKKIQ
jgi:hypothetical protein